MCQTHNPITLYEHGGKTVVCANCGAILEPWHFSSERGSADNVCLVILSASLSVFLAFFAWILGAHISWVTGDIAAGVVFLVALFVIMGRLKRICNQP